MMHSQVDPGHDVLLEQRLAVEELVELHERRLGEVLVERGAGEGLGVVLARDGEELLGVLRGFDKPGRVHRGQVDIGDAGGDAVAARDAPFVELGVVVHGVHCLAVGREVEKAVVFGGDGGEVEARHFEGATFGVPG